jgi:alcohol dehydrogenase (cytochrome c)
VTHLFYFMTLEDCSVYSAKTEKFEEGRAFYSTGVKHRPDEDARKYLLAFDLKKGEFVWRNTQVGNSRSFAGVMSTATGLVFFGDDAQEVEMVDARTGASLWHFNVGQMLHASPMSYAVDGKQYFAIAAGSDLFSFALP